MTSLINYINNTFDASWNRNDLAATLTCFAEDAQVITIPALPGEPDTYTGPSEIRQFVTALMQNFHVKSKDFRENGNRVYWYAEVSSDSIRQMGVPSMGADCEALITSSKVKLFKVTFTPETLAKLQATAQIRRQA